MKFTPRQRPSDIIKAKVTEKMANAPKYDVDFRSTSGPTTEIIVGDCRQVLTDLNPEVKPKLIFGDPPFNIGQKYNEFRDDLPVIEYEDFIKQWVRAAALRVAYDGVLCVHVPDYVVPLVMKAETPGMELTSWVILHYRFGQHTNTKWINSKCHCLIYTRGDYTWNPEAVFVPTDRATVYNDSRTDGSKHPGKRVPLDVWGIPSDGEHWGRVQDGSKERWNKKHGAPFDHPNQLPEKYLERLIRAYTNPGDLVMDPFCGSGTTGTVARALRRRSISIDISRLSAESAFNRMTVRGAVRV